MDILTKNILVFIAYVFNRSFASPRYISISLSEFSIQNRLQFALSYFRRFNFFFTIFSKVFNEISLALFATSNYIIKIFLKGESIRSSWMVFNPSYSKLEIRQFITNNNIFQNSKKPKL
jgi:hypothetical protein